MRTTMKKLQTKYKLFPNKFPTSTTGDLLHVYNISSVNNVHHITHYKKFNKLLQGTHISN